MMIFINFIILFKIINSRPGIFHDLLLTALPRLREDITHKMFFCKMCVRETNDTAWNNVRQHERDKWGS